MNYNTLTTISAVAGLSFSAYSQPTLQEHWWHAWSNFAIEVEAAAHDPSSNTLFVGHNDILWVPPVPSDNGAVVDNDEGWPGIDHDTPNGVIYAAISDGAGGWFVGGAFTEIGGTARNRLARLNGDGSLNSTWDPLNQVGVQGGDVRTLLLHDGVLYVGGNFTSAGGSSRYRLAAFDAATASLTTWNAGQSGNNGIVHALAYGNGFLYAGGTFSNLGGAARSRVAQLELLDATATPWAATPSSDVFTISYNNNNVYIGGRFSTVNGTQRSRIAALDGTTGSLLPWNPSASGGLSVDVIVISGDTAFIGGDFTSMGGSPRNYVAAVLLGLDENNALPWSPSVNDGTGNGAVHSLKVDANRVYIGGDFREVGGVSRLCVAAIDRGAGLTLSWDPSAYSDVNQADVWALAGNGPSIYVGGNFSAIGTRGRSGVSAFDISTGKPTGFQIDLNAAAGGYVYALEQSGDTLFIGGAFSSVNGAPRNNLAAIDKTTGELLNWEVNVQGTVSSLVREGNRLYVGGSFTSVNGIPRNHMAAINCNSASVVLTWQADVTGVASEVRTLAVDQDRLFIVGYFDSVGGVARNNIAAVSMATGVLQPWLPSVPVSASSGFETINDRVYVQREDFPWSLMALESLTGDVDATWNCPTCDGSGGAPRVVEAGGSRLYTFRTTFPYSLVAIDWATGISASWSPEINGLIYVMLRDGNYLFTGGTIGAVDGNSRRCLAVWEVPDDFEDSGTGMNNGIELPSNPIYPNPTTGQFFLDLNASALVTVFDAGGRAVLAQHQLQGTRHALSMGTVSDGLYTVRIVQDGRVENRRLVVQH